MKDITRIHIAKVPYSIELSAKKELEKYISALEAYTADDDLMMDIEIRITELLTERGIKQEEVISSLDVESIREQLGEPKEFMADDAVAEVDTEVLSNDGVRKLYRNLDSAVLGGVLSGIASYLRINALWVRLAFIFLVFISFGIFTLLYIVAWLIIPPARTAAEKLQMSGRPVTLSSIRELNELGLTVNTERRTAIIKRVLTTFLGIAAIGMALVSILTLIAAWIELVHRDGSSVFNDYQIPLILMFVSGALLFVLSLLVAFASFAQKFNKRIWISGIIIIALGLSTFGTALSIGVGQQRFQHEMLQRNIVEVSEKLPANFSGVTSLEVDMSNSTHFNYIVDADALTIKQRMVKDSPKAKVIVENGVAKISLEDPKEYYWGAEEAVTVYGPAIKSIVMTRGGLSYEAGVQSVLSVVARNNSSISLGMSRIDTLEATLSNGAQLSADRAAIATVRVSLSDQPDVTLGNIKTLSVKSADVCGADTKASLRAGNIFGGTFEYNGQRVVDRSFEDPCFSYESDEQRYEE